MNTHVTLPDSTAAERISLRPWRLKDHVMDRCLFLTEDHLAAYQSLEGRLLGKEPYAVLRSDNEALLGYYTLLCGKHFRQHHKLAVTTIGAPGAHAFLETINGVLEKISLDMALGTGQKRCERQLLILRDAERTDPANWQLLYHLVRNFPGLNLALLFVTQSPLPDNPLSTHLGARLHEQELTPVTVSECAEIRDAVRHWKHGDGILRLLDRLAPALAGADPALA